MTTKTADEWASELDITVDYSAREDDAPSATCNNAAEVIRAAQMEAWDAALDAAVAAAAEACTDDDEVTDAAILARKGKCP